MSVIYCTHTHQNTRDELLVLVKTLRFFSVGDDGEKCTTSRITHFSLPKKDLPISTRTVFGTCTPFVEFRDVCLKGITDAIALSIAKESVAFSVAKESVAFSIAEGEVAFSIFQESPFCSTSVNFALA
jgi:hypothetical protein